MAWRRKDLRKKETDAEQILWRELRNNKLGAKFKRQYSVENYVLDFYCPAKKLAIELDGESHATKKQYDEYRTRTLNAYGIREIRFWNHEVESNLEKILRMIKDC